jgi:molecular chaperone DnaK
VKAAIAANNTVDMNSAMEGLTQAQHKAAEALYKQPDAGGAEEATESAPASGSQDDVIDAEVVEEEKK